MRDGIRNYSLAIMPERVLRRAFVPAQYWPRAYGAATGGGMSRGAPSRADAAPRAPAGRRARARRRSCAPA